MVEGGGDVMFSRTFIGGHFEKGGEEANSEPLILLTVIKHSRHLKTLQKCRKHLLAAFPMCSQMLVVFYHSVQIVTHGLISFFIY